MAPDSVTLLVLALLLALATAVVTAGVWDRIRGWERFAARPLAVLLCVATAAAAGLVAVNHELELFGTWSEVVGAPPPTAADGPGLTAAEPGHGSGSRIVSFTVHGKASHITLPVYAYLPPGYQARGPRLPVIEALDGFPGSPQAWLKALAAPAHLDEEIAAHRMPQTVVLFPYQTVDAHRDLECTDAVGGPAMDTFLTTDVPAVVGQLLRVRTDAASWGLIGYSAGGFCSVNLALRHPDRFAAAASLSGYFEALTDSTTGDLYHGDRAVQNANSPLWRVASLPVPPLSLYLATAQDDHFEYSQMEKFAALAKPPLRLTLATVPLGGHSKKVWRQMEGPAFDWLAAHLAGPLPDGTQPDDTLSATGPVSPVRPLPGPSRTAGRPTTRQATTRQATTRQSTTRHSAGKAPGVSSASTAR